MKKHPPRDPRFEFEADISHDVVIPDILYDGKIFNLSSGGIYFESNELIEPDDEISLTVKKLDGSEMTFDVLVTRRERIDTGEYRFGYGARTITPSKAIVNILDSEQTPPPQKERRQHSRLDYNKIMRFRDGDKIWRVWVKDISLGGAFIQTDMNFAIGRRIILNIGNKNTGNIRRKGRIVRLSEAGFAVRFDRRKIERRNNTDRRNGQDRR
jgi:hypothetical protein